MKKREGTENDECSFFDECDPREEDEEALP